QAYQNVGYRLDLDTASTPAADPEGIAGYRVDYNNDGTWDTGVRLPDGTPAPDFTADPAWTYTTAGSQTIKVEIRDTNVPPDTSVCDLAVTVAAGAMVTLDPLPVPGGINWDHGSDSASAVSTSPVVLVAAPTGGDVYHAVYRAVGAIGLNVYRSTDGGQTWPGPGNPVPLFANGLYTTSGTAYSLGLLANGLPALAIRDGGSDLTYIAAQSEAGGTINWGGTTAGVEIEPNGTWVQPVVLPHPTNANRVYIVSQNQSSTSAGPNVRMISLWLSTNGASANPTFTLLPTNADTTDGGASTEFNIRAAMDSAGNIHVAWLPNARNTMIYRRWIDDGSATGGSWAGPETVIGTAQPTGVTNPMGETMIAVNASNEPAVAWSDEDPAANPTPGSEAIYLTKYSAATGWSTPLQVSNTITSIADSASAPNITFDAVGRIHVVWQSNRAGTSIDEIWGSVLNPTGTVELVNDFVILSAPDSTMDFSSLGRNVYSPSINKVLVNSVVSWAAPDGRSRYRLYQTTP
ncbi:MAG TPA: hypothetical protein VEI97_19385, partial [bacterium]|nr:hypothetical protein [bacterium]